MGLYNGVATVENSMVVPQKVTYIINYYMIQQFHFWVIHKRMKAGTQIIICTLVFTAALFTIAKRWKQPKSPSTDKWINKMCTHIQWDIIQP